MSDAREMPTTTGSNVEIVAVPAGSMLVMRFATDVEVNAEPDDKAWVVSDEYAVVALQHYVEALVDWVDLGPVKG